MTTWLRYVSLYWLGLNTGLALHSALSNQAVRWASIEGYGIACAVLAGVPLLVWMAYHTRRSLKGGADSEGAA